MDLIIVAVILTIVWLVYNELNKDTVIIEAFQVPTDLEKQNITGQAIANKLIDQIQNIKSNADTSFKKFDITTVYYDTQLELVIPGSGISLKSLMNNIKIFLGRKQTRISGEVVLNKKLFLTIRVQGEQSKTFSGELGDLDNILSEAAKYILKYTHPYLLAYYLYYNFSENKDEALDMIKYSLTHPPYDDDPMAYTLDGYVKWDEKKFDESIALYKKAIELDPDYVDAYSGWGYTLYDQKKYDEAAEVYKKALKIDPKNTYTNHYVGMNFEAQNNIDSAVIYYKKSIELDPNYDNIYVSYGKLLRKQKKYDEAIEMFNKAIEIEPRAYDAYEGLGEVYADQNKYDDAILMFYKSIEIKPEFSNSYTDLGNVFSGQKKFTEANDMYKKAIKLDSTNADLYKKLGLNLEEQNKYPEAIDLYKKAAKNIPLDSSYYNMRIEELLKSK